MGWAVVEMVVALTAVVFAAILNQASLGRTLRAYTNPEEYDFYHGQWHFLLGLVVALPTCARWTCGAVVVQGRYQSVYVTCHGMIWLPRGCFLCTLRCASSS